MSSNSGYAANYDDVIAASRRLAGAVHRTPIIENRSLDERANCAGSRSGGSGRDGPRQLFFKCENLQRVGAFKFRGALNAVNLLAEADAKRGVVTHSSGNHAQALALAASMRGIPAHIVMPTSAPRIKRDAVIGYGATVVDCEPTLQARESTTERVRQETGATLIHPYNNPHVIAGQGTVALEFVEQVPELDLIIAPVGGGGLLSGTAIVAHHHGIDVIGAEPLAADDAARSMAAGELIPQTSPDTVADGLLTSLGELTWPILRDLVNQIVTVDDQVTIEEMRYFWQRTKLLIEPSSAVAVAAALSDKVLGNDRWKRIGIILSGGNVDFD